MDISALSNPLPGYRDTRLYYDQLFSILRECRDVEQASDLLPGDQVVRNSTAEHFVVHLSEEEYQRRRNETDVQPWVELVLQHRDFGLTLLREMESGHIRRMAIHGDTKLDNFLFGTRDGQAKALIDLDTIMPHTWLADWGDMVRSLCNVAGEKTRDLSQVRVDREIYRAVADGFLSTVRKASAEEIELMCNAVRIIALELGLRFLTDYLRGDTYFLLAATDPLDLNKRRAQVQLTLFQQLTEEMDWTRSCVESLRVR
jgi:N-acetylhexosamine 1-kinase